MQEKSSRKAVSILDLMESAKQTFFKFAISAAAFGFNP